MPNLDTIWSRYSSNSAHEDRPVSCNVLTINTSNHSVLQYMTTRFSRELSFENNLRISSKWCYSVEMMHLSWYQILFVIIDPLKENNHLRHDYHASSSWFTVSKVFYKAQIPSSIGFVWSFWTHPNSLRWGCVQSPFPCFLSNAFQQVSPKPEIAHG